MHICMYKPSTAANAFESLKNETLLLPDIKQLSRLHQWTHL